MDTPIKLVAYSEEAEEEDGKERMWKWLISTFIIVVLSVVLSGSEYYTSLIGVSLADNTDNTKN